MMRLHYRLGWLVLRAAARVLFGLRVFGAENIPQRGPVVIAPNHVSYVDPVVVGLGVPRELHFLAKEELFRPFLFGSLIKAYNAIPIRRGAVDRGALKLAIGVLKRGDALLVFPEGTRSKDGELLPSRPGIGFLASESQAAIIPCYVAGSRKIVRAIIRRPRLELRYGKPINLPSGDKDREMYKLLGEKTMEVLRELKEEWAIATGG
jgi:1-acyl-sn-glycerol-3-phosphate acyltransferase